MPLAVELVRLIDCVVGAAPFGAAVFDRELRVSWANAALAQLCRCGAGDLAGRTLRELLPAVAARLEAELEAVLSHGCNRECEVQPFGPGADGVTPTTWLFRFFPVVDAGQRVGIGCEVNDLTAQRRREALLRESETRARSIIENASDGFCAIDRDGVYRFVNRAAERILGRPREELLGQRIEVAYPRIVETRFHGELRRVLHEGRRFDLEEEYPGSGHWFDVHGFPSPNGATIYFRDITRRRRTDAEQRLLAEAGRVLSESLDCKETLERIADLLVPELADMAAVLLYGDGEQPAQAFAHVEQTERERLRELFARYPLGSDPRRGMGRVRSSGETWLVPRLTDEVLREAARDEEHFAALRSLGASSLLVGPLRARGRTFGLMVMACKPPRRTFHHKQLPFVEELARRAALAVDNAHLYQLAQEAVRLREDMVAIASHDLRTPLAALGLRAQRLQRSIQRVARGEVACEPAFLDEQVGHIARLVERTGEMVSSFLEVSKIAAGRIELALEEVDLPALVREIAARFNEQAQEAGSILWLGGAAELVGRWDRARIDQIVSNLLANALKYGRGQPIELRVATRSGHAVLTVRDRGVGIAPEEQAAIFERFRRAASGRERAGFGLGLWIVRHLVEAHRGAISVTSTPGEGSCFTVDLPL